MQERIYRRPLAFQFLTDSKGAPGIKVSIDSRNVKISYPDKEALAETYKLLQEALILKDGTTIDLQAIGLPFSIQVFSDYAEAEYLQHTEPRILTWRLEQDDIDKLRTGLKEALSLAG
jgi:hypothetical protein